MAGMVSWSLLAPLTAITMLFVSIGRYSVSASRAEQQTVCDRQEKCAHDRVLL